MMFLTIWLLQYSSPVVVFGGQNECGNGASRWFQSFRRRPEQIERIYLRKHVYLDLKN